MHIIKMIIKIMTSIYSLAVGLINILGASRGYLRGKKISSGILYYK
jgi:hypothetical protein